MGLGAIVDQQNTVYMEREKKHTVNDYLGLDVRKIRSIFLDYNAGLTSTWTVTTGPFGKPQSFTSTLTLAEMELYLTNPFGGERIRVTILPRKAFFGGWRKFFECPFCNRVCELIYFSQYDYGCRVCLELTYISVQEAHKKDRFLRFLFPGIALKLAKKIHRELFKK
jgi:hypothetical protein